MGEGMKRIITFFLLAFFAGAGPIALTQTRPRRIDPGQPTNNPAVVREPAGNNPASDDNAEKADVVRIDTSLVTVPVTVMDRGGRHIPDLRRDNFHVFEDGIEQKLAFFAAVDRPFTVVIMLDTSASTWSKLELIKEAAWAFVEQLRSDDQVMVVSFAKGLKVQCEPTEDRQKVRKAIAGTGKGLSTHLYDAMDRIMLKHLDRIQGRKAVVLFTDGVDAFSNDATYESTLRTAEELDALIYPIRYDTYDPASDDGITTSQSSRARLPSILRKLPLPFPTIGSSGGGSGSSRADYDRGQRYLQTLAAVTGGQAYEAGKDLRYLQDVFSRIAIELRRQYSVGYYPSRKGASGERRRIRVSIDRPDVAVRARESYVYKGEHSPTGDSTTTKRPGGSPTAPVLKKQQLARLPDK
jgi:VWFA-related protein